MNGDPASELSGELSSGERLLWSGKPRQGILFRTIDFFMIPYGLMWVGVAFFWEFMTLPHLSGNRTGNFPGAIGIVLPLFGLLIVLNGLYIIFGRFFVDMKQRENTVYGITNQRIIIRTGLFTGSTKSLNLRTLSDVSLTERSDQYGTITFRFPRSWLSFLLSYRSAHVPPCFDTIPEAKRVYEIIRKAQNET